MLCFHQLLYNVVIVYTDWDITDSFSQIHYCEIYSVHTHTIQLVIIFCSIHRQCIFTNYICTFHRALLILFWRHKGYPSIKSKSHSQTLLHHKLVWVCALKFQIWIYQRYIYKNYNCILTVSWHWKIGLCAT